MHVDKNLSGTTLIFILFLFTTAYTQGLTLQYASTLPDSDVQTMAGSLAGGTRIYIKGSGFDPIAQNNQVILGGLYPCNIVGQGVVTNFISCDTTNSLSSVDVSNLNITVKTNGQTATLSTSTDKFSYAGGSTPYLYAILPSAAIAESFVQFYGIHSISNLGNDRDLGDIRGLKIGNHQCGRFDFGQSTINPNSLAMIKCQTATFQEAGKYNVNEQVIPGYAINTYRLRKSSFVNEYYQFAVLPAVSGILPQNGGIGGQDVTITGTGFSNDISKISVSIDNVNCAVTTSTLSQIKCRMAPKLSGTSAKLSTTSNNQVNGYVSGSGFQYTKYDISSLSSYNYISLKAALKGANSLTVIETGTRAQLQTPNVDSNVFGQVFKGYFYAPVSGQYRFQGTADDNYGLYINNVSGSAEIGDTPYIYTNSYDNNFNPYYNNISTSFGDPLTFQAGKYYYMELYYVNSGGDGYIKISVSVPNTNPNLYWQTYEVNQFSTSLTNDPQIVQFVAKGATSGTYTIKYYKINPQTLLPIEDVNVNLPYNASLTSFINALNQFSGFRGYGISGILTIKDQTGSVTTNSSLGFQFIYKISISALRPASVSSSYILNYTSNVNGTFTFNQQQIQPHSPLISGTFTLEIDGYPINLYDSSTSQYSNSNLPYDISGLYLQSLIRRIPKFSNVVVQRKGTPSTGATWIISYMNYQNDVNDLVLNPYNLIGGKTGTKPTIDFWQTRKFSTNLLFSPVDYNFLFSTASSPQVLVKVNNMPSSCTGTCSYSFINIVPQIIMATLTGSQLNIGLSSPTGSLSYTLNDLIINFDGLPCTVNLAGTKSNFYCQLQTNTDNTPKIRAGNLFPEVKITGIGYALPANNVNSIVVPLLATSLTPSTGGNNGGYNTVLLGHGFPNDLNQISITICDTNATIISVNNIQAILIIPACSNNGSQTLTISYNGLTTTLPFTYTIPNTLIEIYQISPQSASPVLKDILEIYGNNFGSNETNVTVFLSNSSGRVYQMRVLVLNNTYIKVGIPGGLPGEFKVIVDIEGYGQAIPTTQTANLFTYQLVILGLSPKIGSAYGGTLINITGVNLSPDPLQTLVTVGTALSWICTLQIVTQKYITCRTPPRNQAYTNADNEVFVSNRLILDATCNGTCMFTYMDNASSPSISSTTLVQSLPGSTLTMTGTNFGSSPSVVLTNQISKVKTVITPTSSSSTSITITVPNIQSGFYSLTVRNDPIGESNFITFKVIMNVTSISPSTGSTQGAVVSLIGFGLPHHWPNPSFTITIVSNSKYIIPNIVQTSPGSLQLAIPAGVDAQSYNITIQNPLGAAKSLTFTQRTTATPTLSMTSTNNINAGSISISLNRTLISTSIPSIIKIYPIINPSQEIPVDVSTVTAVGKIISFTATLSPGAYGFKVFYSSNGWSVCTSQLNVLSSSNISIDLSLNMSYNGGYITIYGDNINSAAIIQVGGFRGKVKSVQPTYAVFNVPALITAETITTFPSLRTISKIKTFTTFADSTDSLFAFDSIIGTNYISSNPTCNVGLDLGAELSVYIDHIRFFPYPLWTVASNYLQGGIFQGSNDNSAWTDIYVIDSGVHSGWNTIQINSSLSTFRYVRFSHTIQSSCKIAQIQVYGYLYSNINVDNVTSKTVDVKFNDGFNVQTFTNALQFKEDATPIVQSISPPNGDVFGGYTINLTGNYPTGNCFVYIDGIQCSIQSCSQTEIICTVGSRLTLPANGNSFQVIVDNKKAITNVEFEYVMRWSDIRTWGTDLPPIAGDLVSVPTGMTLYVDQTTPNLAGIIVEGSIIFADESDMQIEAGFITINKGKFIAGTEEKPYQHKLTFLLHGDYYGAQQPIFGNKGIGCLQCQFSMYGIPRTPTWTMISNTINIGATSFSVIQDVDWKAGQHIVVASTSFDHNEAQEFIIMSVTANRTIQVNKPFKYKHFGGVQTYGTHILEMRAQVGLLTRNILVTGDDISVQKDYGAHLMMAGLSTKGLKGHIAYTQFTKCGQPAILGRYCIHFHMNGDVMESYVRGNAVHHSMARVITIHGVHFLHVQKNVGYLVKGHNYFVEDGIETNNLIQYNLAISSLTVSNMLQTDISVASFWITNPSNNVRFNHAAGGDFYGFWYEIKLHPDGPSATSDICPSGNMLGESHDNVAHSYKRFGLRIFQLASRQYPCNPSKKGDLNDPWKDNPSFESRFYNYIIYKNQQSGVLDQYSGNVVFDNFTIAQNIHSGMQFYKTNLTKQFVMPINTVIIGVTQGNSPMTTSSASGIITPKTDGFKLSNVGFYNFIAGQTILQTCSKCQRVDAFINTAREVFLEGITYNNVNGNYLKMNGLKREIVYDLDGTYTSNIFDGTNRSSATVVNNLMHLSDDPACVTASIPSKWGNSLTCSPATIRRVMLLNPQSFIQFSKNPMKIQLLNNITEEVSRNSSNYSSVYSTFGGMEPMIDKPCAWAVPMITGRVYAIWWLTGIDFTHMAIDSSRYFTPQDQGIILKFNYTENRQFYQIGALNNMDLLFNGTYQDLDPINCSNGDYYHDIDNRTLQVCVSGKNRSIYEYIDINGIKCRYLCPSPTGQFTRENFIRKWSNVTQWPFGRLPVDGENVTVNGNWTIIMDINPAAADLLTIDGVVIVGDSFGDVTIRANSIWIRAGELRAGDASTPFPNKLTIELLGNHDDKGFVISPQVAGNKMMVVTGLLSLYGIAPSTIWTRLTQFAHAGTNTIRVSSSTGWKVGDQIVLAPSFKIRTQYQKFTITAMSSNLITLNRNLAFNHYGASAVTINNAYGQLDTRAAVGHLTRNIKIQAGNDAGWGYRVLIYGFNDAGIVRVGQTNLVGVQIKEGGQYDTQKSAIQVLNVLVNAQLSIISKSSIHDCHSYCLSLSNARQFKIDNNVFYNGTLFHVKALDVSQYTFTNNVMIGAHQRYTVSVIEQITCYSSYKPVTTANQVSVMNNLCQGSQGHGFALPFLQCADIDNNPFINNVAGSCNIGFIYTKVPGVCMAGSSIRAYACNICHMGHSPHTHQMQYKDFIMADCNRAVTLRFGGQGDDRTAYFSNSYITAISRPTCTQCYGVSATDCTDNQAIRMLSVTVNGQQLPTKFGPGYDVICQTQVFDCKAFISGVTFQNFNLAYAQLPQCSNNVIFRPHSLASDLVGSHHTANTTCKNCSIGAFGKFDPPDPSELTWFGGCGDILCTGKNNYLIQDHDGTFLPGGGTLLANNSVIGDAIDNCTYYSYMNGHHCLRDDLGVLEYQSIAPDFNTRVTWPVTLTYDGGNWTSVTNAYKQWDWVDGQPQNRRQNRFISVIQYQMIYNMTFGSMPPQDMKLQFQRRTITGNNSDWIIVKLYYPKPNSIRIQVNGLTIAPIPDTTASGQGQLLNNVNICGANKFFYKNYTVHFVITGAKNCQVRVSLTNSIQLSAHFDMNINDFYNDTLQTKFIDRMCALLQITDTSRLKIVGIYTGSVLIQLVIEDPVTTTVDNSTVTNDQVTKAAEMARVAALLKSLIQSGNLNSSLISAGLGPIISATFQSYTLVDTTSNNSSPNPTPTPTPNSPTVNPNPIINMSASNVALIVGVVVGSVILIVAITVGVICYLRKRAKVLSNEDGIAMNSQDIKIRKDENIPEDSILQFGNKL